MGVVEQFLGDQVELAGFGLGEQVGVLLLNAAVAWPARRARQAAGALDPPDGRVARTEQAGLAGFGKGGEGIDGLR